ncbi:hypothetical protein AB0K00_30890 [Dactylosporangium sp. NPDC049525]|uniref:hypothetical protein n=1 Tax=Dactylosporangium sp. NPDC049525 TaxID=3154730 RepID=UPI003414ABC9
MRSLLSHARSPQCAGLPQQWRITCLAGNSAMPAREATRFARCALLALLRAPDTRLDDRAVCRLLVLVGVGSLVLLTVRQLGPALLTLIVTACATLARPGRIAQLWRRRDTRWIIACSWSLGLAGWLGWLAYSGVARVAPVARDAQHLTSAQLAQLLATRRIPFYFQQIVGQFGYGETKLPLAVVAAWYLLLGALVVPSLIHGGRRLALVAASLGTASIGLLVALELHYLPNIGWFAHGRYAMPAAAGVVLCAASAPQFERRLVRLGRLRRYCTCPDRLRRSAAPVHPCVRDDTFPVRPGRTPRPVRRRLAATGRHTAAVAGGAGRRDHHRRAERGDGRQRRYAGHRTGSSASGPVRR